MPACYSTHHDGVGWFSWSSKWLCMCDLVQGGGGGGGGGGV
jgi:hypothetical protein